MVLKYYFFNIVAASLCFLSCHAWAQGTLTAINYPEPANFKGQYVFAFDSIPIGRMGIEVDQTPHRYTITADVVTSGILKVFVKHSSHTTVSATGSPDINPEFTYPDRQYESHYQTRGKKKYVKMITKGGSLTEDTLVPPDNPATRPKVLPGELKNAVDPLSMTLRMREEVWKAMKNNASHFSIPLYDGRRLTEVDFTMDGKKTLRTPKGKVPVIAISVTRKLLAGFTKTEMDEHDPDEPQAHFFFSDDAKLVPVRAEVKLWMGTLSATLAKECGAGESCLLGITE